jgi:heterotetrameric sarcosine oxidase gamma subunit
MKIRVSKSFEVVRIVDGFALRVKSWGPLPTGDRGPVVLGGVMLPATVGDTAEGSPGVLCTGPGEWLLIEERTRTGAARFSLEEFEREARTQGLAVADLSDGLVGLALKGVSAWDALAGGCGVDFHGRNLPWGRCVRTRLAQIPVVVVRMEKSSEFELYVPRSYAQYLTDWLNDTLME